MIGNRTFCRRFTGRRSRFLAVGCVVLNFVSKSIARFRIRTGYPQPCRKTDAARPRRHQDLRRRRVESRRWKWPVTSAEPRAHCDYRKKAGVRSRSSFETPRTCQKLSVSEPTLTPSTPLPARRIIDRSNPNLSTAETACQACRTSRTSRRVTFLR